MVNYSEQTFYTIVLIGFFLLPIGIIVSAAFIHNNRRKNRLLEQSRLGNAILGAKLEIQEQTFKHISQEIHDNIGQLLSLIKINLATVADDQEKLLKEERTSDQERKRQQWIFDTISFTKDLITKTIYDLRNLSHNLNKDYITKVGLERALENELDAIRKTGKYEVTFSSQGSIKDFEDQRELITFRITQELLQNAIKHGDATQISVSMYYQLDHLRLIITDNGKGLDIQNALNSKETGLGLMTLFDRIKLVHGTLTFDSAPGQGTTATITIPYHTS